MRDINSILAKGTIAEYYSFFKSDEEKVGWVCVRPDYNPAIPNFVWSKTCRQHKHDQNICDMFMDSKEDFRYVDLKIKGDREHKDYDEFLDKLIERMNKNTMVIHISSWISGNSGKDTSTTLSSSNGLFEHVLNRICNEVNNHFILQVCDKVEEKSEPSALDFITKRVNTLDNCVTASYQREFINERIYKRDCIKIK
tara:strand:- start:4345 stop:4935 length:591 start_codon:yes stop_codon:yes gene_type:complete